MQGRAFVTIALALAAGLFTVFLWAKPAMTLPDNFTDSPVTNVSAPTALAFTPDNGRMLVTSKSGQLHVFDQNGTELSSPALDISTKVCSNSERGLLGVAVDPQFATNHFIYLYYTFKKSGKCPEKKPQLKANPVNRVSRFVMNNDNNTVDVGSEEILLNNIPSPNGNHNGGDVKFGNDGNLYVSVGDGGCNYRKPSRCQYQNSASRYRNVLLGKILRITPEGGIPQDNPFTDSEDSRRCNVDGRTVRGKDCRETFARGFRNPFRIAFDPDDSGTSFRINDVGGQRWEEIDQAQSGADYGWNVCEGLHNNPERPSGVNCQASSKYVEPIYNYSHEETNCGSITGGAFVPNNGSWPGDYDDSYLYGDFVCGKIFELKPVSGGEFNATPFEVLDGGRRPVAMAFGPSPAQDLYYTAFDFNGGPDQVRRILYTPPGP
jgi:glucose/arabinose dehydrogenase